MQNQAFLKTKSRFCGPTVPWFKFFSFFFLARLADSWATREVVASPSGSYCSTVQNCVREMKKEWKEIQSNIHSSPQFPFVASKQMLAISCAQDDTLNIDDNVKVFMSGGFIFNCSCVAVFIYIQNVSANTCKCRASWEDSARPLAAPPPRPPKSSLWTARKYKTWRQKRPRHPLRVCELCRITHARIKRAPFIMSPS